MTLYHGSFTEIDEIDLSNCQPHTDFGRGFYLTTIYEHARNRANRKAQEAGTAPVVNSYSFNEKVMASGKLKVKLFSDNSDGWAEFILNNRNDPEFHHDYDLVVGPIADDTMRKQFFRYEAGIISLDELARNLTFSEENIQYCFCTKKAIRLLKKI